MKTCTNHGRNTIVHHRLQNLLYWFFSCCFSELKPTSIFKLMYNIDCEPLIRFFNRRCCPSSYWQIIDIFQPKIKKSVKQVQKAQLIPQTQQLYSIPFENNLFNSQVPFFNTWQTRWQISWSRYTYGREEYGHLTETSNYNEQYGALWYTVHSILQ